MARANRLASARRQRGIAAIFAAVSLVTLLSALALAIDVGRLYYANRDLQRLADLAAIDGARVYSQCLGSAGIDEVQAEVDASLKRNKLPKDVTVVTRVGSRETGSDGLQFFLPVEPKKARDSVQVTLSRASPARILPLFTDDASRTLTTRAAAQAEWLVSASANAVGASPVQGNFAEEFFGRALGATINLGGGAFAAGTSARVEVAGLVSAGAGFSANLPGRDEATPVVGLLGDLSNLLNETGDTAAAAAVDAFADAVAAGRPGATVVPAEVLGLPLQGSYDGATATVGDILNAIAGSISNGEPIQLANLCDLLPAGVDATVTSLGLPGLCNSSVTARIPQPSRPGSFNSTSQILDVSNSSDDAATTAGGLVEVRTRIVNPLNGQPFELPALIVIGKSEAEVTNHSCARLGQPQYVANVRAHGPRAQLLVGNSSTFTTPDVDLSRAVDDLTPVLIPGTVQQLLAATGVDTGLLGPLLNASVLGQPITISVMANSGLIGDGSEKNLCMQGPLSSSEFSTSEQCNGAPATVGGLSSQQAIEQLANIEGDLRVEVRLPAGLPPQLSGPLDAAKTRLEQTLTAELQPVLRLLAEQLVPVLRSANLVVGESQVTVTAAKRAILPEVYAQ